MVMCLRLMGCIVSVLALVGVSLVPAIDVEAQSTRPSGEWHATGGDHTNTKYSPLDEITPENFLDLEFAWRWTSIETEVTAQRLPSCQRLPTHAMNSAVTLFNNYKNTHYKILKSFLNTSTRRST